MTLGAVIMVGGSGTSPQERMVLEAQRAATLDLIELIQTSTDAELIISSPELTWFPKDVDAHLELDTTPFHFGSYLAGFIEQYQLERVLYFGGGSAPLLDAANMGMIADLLVNAGEGSRIPSHIVLTNNRHSSDWVCISHVAEALPIIRQTERDNSLAWALDQSGEYAVRVIAGLRPATSMDLDTPTDLALARHHPHCPPHLAVALQIPALDPIPVKAVLDTLSKDGSQVAMLGRVSPLAWQALNKATQCWLRVYAEERGMVASERLKNGEVRSMMGELIRVKGTVGFFETLAEICDAAIIDSRVLMADILGELPPASDRFASDLFWADQIQNPWLKEFTQAAQECAIPVLLGGHNVVAGGLYALVEMLPNT